MPDVFYLLEGAHLCGAVSSHCVAVFTVQSRPAPVPVSPFCDDHQIGAWDLLVPRFLDLVLTKGSRTLGRERAVVRTL